MNPLCLLEISRYKGFLYFIKMNIGFAVKDIRIFVFIDNGEHESSYFF